MVNPIAGIGGPLGLGGSDELSEEIRRSADAVAKRRAVVAIESMSRQICYRDIKFLTCSGQMGEHALAEHYARFDIIYQAPIDTSAEDTRISCDEFLSGGTELVIFVGGDGTAIDVYDSVKRSIPILGIPSGVKMHSSVFVNRPIDAGWTLQNYYENRTTTDGEIMDVDGDSFRAGRVSARLYATALIPDVHDAFQSNKSPSGIGSEKEELESIADYFIEIMDRDILYVFGTGSTVAMINRKLGIEKSELSVNAVLAGREIQDSLDEHGVLDLIERHRDFRIVVSPIGGQGFVFGRGNQQLSASVLSRAGRERIIILATTTKLGKIAVLRCDTGDTEIDRLLKGYWKVLVGHGKYRAMRME